MRRAANKCLRTCDTRLIEPCHNALGGSMVDQRREIGMFVQRMTDFQIMHKWNEGVEEGLIHRIMDENPLHTNARLTGIAEAADRATRRSQGEVGIEVDDAASIAAKFQQHALAPGALLHGPASGNRASE